MTWSSDTLLTNTLLDHWPVTLALDSRGRPHVSWGEYVFLGGSWVWYQDTKDDGITWRPSILIAGSDSSNIGLPSVAVDGLDRVYVFYKGDPGILYCVSEDSGARFGPSQTLPIYPDGLTDDPLSVTGDPFGGVHVVWIDTSQAHFNGLSYNGSTDGGRTWRYNPYFPLMDNHTAIGSAITADRRGGVHVITAGGDSVNEYIRYRSGFPLGVEEQNPRAYGVNHLLLSVQNPTRQDLKISYFLPSRSKVSIVLYDLLGRQVAELVEGEKPAGQYEVRRSLSLPAGVYFLRLVSGGEALTRKVVVIR